MEYRAKVEINRKNPKLFIKHKARDIIGKAVKKGMITMYQDALQKEILFMVSLRAY